MPSNSVSKQFTIVVNSKGLVKVTGDIEHLGSAVDHVTRSLGKHNTAQRQTADATDAWSKKAKGVAGIAGSNTKAFSKMSQGMTSSLVPAYATLAANIFAVSAAFRVLKDAADFSRLQQASLEYSQSIGINLGKVSKEIVNITNQSITMQKAMQTASIASAAGFKPETIQKLAEAARNASVALGRDMTDSLDRVFSGALKAEPELLDELGIILRLKPATEAYAATLGKTASQLTTFEKQTAVVNEVIRQADEKFGHLGATMKEGNPYAVIYAKTANAIKIALGTLNTVLGPIISMLTKFDGILLGIAAISLPSVLGLFGKQAEIAFQSFEANALKSVAAVHKVQESLKQASAELKRMQATQAETKQDAAFRARASSKDQNKMGLLVAGIDTSTISLTQKYDIALAKLKVTISGVNLFAKKLSASMSVLGVGFITAISSAESFGVQVDTLTAKITALWTNSMGGSAGGAGFLGKVFKFEELGKKAAFAAKGVATVAVATGKLMRVVITLLPYVGLLTIAWDLLVAAGNKLREWTGTNYEKLGRALEGAASSADIAREALERLDHEVKISSKDATNNLNTMLDGIKRIQREATGQSYWDQWMSTFTDSEATDTLQIFGTMSENMQTLLALMRDSAPEGMAERLQLLADKSENLEDSQDATKRVIVEISKEIQAEGKVVEKAIAAMAAVESVSFESLSSSLADLALNGKDVANIMNAMAEAQEDLKNGAIATSAAVRGISEAMATVTDTSAIQRQLDLDTKLKEDLAHNAKELAAIRKEADETYFGKLTGKTKIHQANILAFEQQAIDLRAKHAQDTSANDPQATQQAKEMLRLLDEMATSRAKISDISNKSKLINVRDVSSLKDFVNLQNKQVDLLDTQIWQARALKTDAENKYAAEQVIADLQEKQLQLLKGTVETAKGLRDGTRENELAYRGIAESALPRIKELLLESKNISEAMATNMLAGLEYVKPKEDSSSDTVDNFEAELDALYRKNVELRLGAEALYQYDLAQKGIFGDQQKYLLGLSRENKLIKQQKKDVADLAKAKSKAAKKAVSDSDKIFKRIKSNAATSLDIFTGPAEGLNDLLVAFDAMSKALDSNVSDIEKNSNAWDTFLNSSMDFTGPMQETKTFYDTDKKLAQESTDVKIQGAKLAGEALINTFDAAAAAAEEGSKKQEALQKTSLALQMVMAIALGANAILTALQGDPYTALARAAVTAGIVAVQLAAIGAQFSGLGGSGSGSEASGLQTTQGRGSVLGDADALSKSLSNSQELLEDYAEIGNRISSLMLLSLENIDNNTKALGLGISTSDQYSALENAELPGFSSSIVSALGKSVDVANKTMQGVGGVISIISGDPIFGAIAKLIASQFGTRSDTVDSGITFGTPADDFKETGNTKGQTFADVRADGLSSNFFRQVDSYIKMSFIKVGSESIHELTLIDGEIATWLRGIVSGVDEALTLGVAQLGQMSIESASDTIGAIDLDLSSLSLQGMSTEKQTEALNAFFSKWADDAVSDLELDGILPSLSEFQQVGEGMFETFARVASTSENATNKLQQFGVSAIGFSDVINKQNDIGPQIVKQSLVAAEQYKVVGEIIQNFTGSVEDLISLKIDLDEVQNLLINTGAGFEFLSAGLVAAADGLDNLSSNLSSYYDNFFTEQEQFEGSFRNLTEIFADFGKELPQTKKDFRDLVDEIHKSGDHQLYARVIAINGLWSDTFDMWEGIQESLEDSTLIWSSAILEANKGNETLLETAGRLHLVALDALAVYDGSEDSLETLQNAIDDRYDAELALIQGIQDAIESIDTDVNTAIRNITLENLDDEDKYNFYAAEADRLADQLRTGEFSSPEQISAAVKEAISAAESAYGILDEDGKAENEAELISFISGIQVDSLALIDALNAIARDSTVDLALETIEVVGMDNIKADISSIAELMVKIEANTAISNAVMGTAMQSTQGIDVSSIVSNSLDASVGADRYLDAATLIVDKITGLVPGVSEGILTHPGITQNLATGLETNPTGIAKMIEDFIYPFLPTSNLLEPGAQTYEDLETALNMRETPTHVVEQNQAATDQIEASNTMLDAATIIREAAETMQEISEYVPAYIQTEGAVNA